MAGQPTPRKHPPSPNGAPTLTPLGHYAGRPDIAISRQITVVGSKPGSRLHLASSTVSQSHAVIVNSSAGPYVRDLAGRTHVYINGKERREADLNDGDLLQIGKFKFQFNAGVPGVGLEQGRDVREPAPEALLNVEGGEMPVPIESRAVLIGRRPTSDVPLIEDSVSTAHAVIFEMNGRRFIRDLGSRTGTFVNGQRINQQAELKFGDTIRIGETTIGYASANGEVAERGDVDEMDHLVSTAPLGTAALEAPRLDREHKPRSSAGDDAGDDAMPMVGDEAADRPPAVAAGGSAAAAEAELPAGDQVRLDSDTDAGGHGDTAFLPAQAEKPRKIPTLKAPPPQAPPQESEPPAPDGEFLEVTDAPQPSAEQSGVVDDALGLTPESRRREAAKADDLSASRRGWRGMPVDQSTLPVAERPTLVDEAQRPSAGAPAEPPLAASRTEAAPAADPFPDQFADNAPESATPLADEEAAHEPLAQGPPVDEEDLALEVEPQAPRAPEPPAPHVTVGEEVDSAEESLPAEMFDLEVEEPSPLAVDVPEVAEVEDKLHLPPIPDDTAEEIEPLALTPEEGAPLDLSVEEPPVTAEEPEPTLDLREPEAEPEAPASAGETLESPAAAQPPRAASRINGPATADDAPTFSDDAPTFSDDAPTFSDDATSSATPQAQDEAAPAREPEPETDTKGKRKRVPPERKPRKKKGAAQQTDESAAPVAPAPLVAPEHEPEPELVLQAPPVEPVAEAQPDAVEIVDETVPTPESALDEDAVADMLAEPLTVEPIETPAAADLSDTGFGRDVDSFVGESTGPLVEARDDEQVVQEAAQEVPPPRAAEDEPELVLDDQRIEVPDAAQQRAELDRLVTERGEEHLSPAEGRERLEAELEESPQPAARGADGAEPVAAGRSDAESAAMEELLADVMGDAPPAADEAAAIDAEIEQLDLAIEEAASDASRSEEPPLDLDELSRVAASRIEPPSTAEHPSDVPSSATPQADEPKPELEPEAVAEARKPEDAPLHVEPAPAARHDAPEPPPAPPAPPPPRAAPASPATWGPNQEHFLGGMPLKLNKPMKPVPAGNAAAAAARQGQPVMPPPPPRATRPNARTRSPWDASTDALGGAVEDLGASIPPFSGTSPKKGQITTGFDGLAMPPVRETDVFSQMAPAAFAAGLIGASGGHDDEDIFSRGARVARQPQQQPPAAKQQQPQQPSAAPLPAGAGDDGVSGASAAADVSSPADGVWADDSTGAEASDEQQPVEAGAAPPPRRNRPLPAPPAFPAGEAQPAKRKRRWFGLRFLLIVMLLLAGGAAGAIYGLVKRQTTVTGKLRFDNFPAKTIERQALLTEQKKLIDDHAFRESARKVLAQRHPDLDPGFLGDALAYEKAAKQADWAPGQTGTFAFTYHGRDERGDPHRVRAVLLALYDANTKKLGGGAGEAGELRQSLASLQAAQSKAEQRVADLKAKIERLNVVALQMPDRKQIEELTSEANWLEKEHTAAARRVLELKLDVERMAAAMPDNPQPAGTAEAPVVDPELSKLQAELDAANNTLAAGKAARAKEAEAAQAALDAALESFQKQVAGAQTVAKDNPELSAYLAAAQELQAGTRDLTQKLIRRQQEQQRRLAEMKTRLAEKFEAKRADTWKRDPELKKLGEELAIAQRQVSAAENGGAPKTEVAELKSHVSLLEEMIKARQTLVGDDQFYADAINQLQKFIDDTQRGIDADRKHTEAELEKMQAAFAKSQPAVEKMPEAQRELAASLGKQLEAINAARRKYNSAADAVAAAGDEEMKRAEAAAAQLAAQIEQRRKQLSEQAAKAATAEQEQGRLTALKSREAELAAAQTAAAETQQALDAAQKALRAAQASEAEAREAGEQRDAITKERDVAQKELETILRNLDLKRSQAASNPEPLVPTESDVEMKVADPRPTYALASVGVIVAVFTILMLVTGTGAAAQPDEVLPRIAEMLPSVDRGLPTPLPQPIGENGNGAVQPQPAQPGDAQSRVAV